MDMTLYYARFNEGDQSLISEVMTERDRLNKIIITDWLTGDDALEGGRGRSIVKFKQRHEVKTADNLSEAIDNLATGISIRSTGHSWCLSNADSCGGQGLYDSLQCGSCDDSVIDKSLLPSWVGLRDQQKNILKLDDIGHPVKYHAQQQIDAANIIIEKLS